MIVLLQPNERQYTVPLENAGYRVIVGNSISGQEQDAAVALVTSENPAVQLANWQEHFPRVRPLLLGDAGLFSSSTDLTLAAAPTLPPDSSVDDILRMLAFLERGDGWLLSELRKIDPHARQLIGDRLCQWVKSRPGIIGIVLLARLANREQLGSILRRLIAHAYNLLDGLPSNKLSVEDIWNVSLLIAVPIAKSKRDPNSDVFSRLHSTSLDVTGSRKLILWLDQSVSDYYGPMSGGYGISELPSRDPLRQTLDAIAIDSAEREVLEIVFKRRFSQEDIDELSRVLGRAK